MCILTTKELYASEEIKITELEEKYNYYLQRYSSFNYYVERWKPFYDTKCFQKLQKVDDICLRAGQIIKNNIISNLSHEIQYEKQIIEYSLERKIRIIKIDLNDEQKIIIDKKLIIKELQELTELQEEIVNEIREFIIMNEKNY